MSTSRRLKRKAKKREEKLAPVARAISPFMRHVLTEWSPSSLYFSTEGSAVPPHDRGAAGEQADGGSVKPTDPQEAGGGGEDQAKNYCEQPVVHGSIINQGGWSWMR